MKTYEFKIAGQSFNARIVEYSDTRVIVDLNGNNYEVEMVEDKPAISTPAATHKRPAPPPGKTVASPQKPAGPPVSGPGAVAAPIPGVVRQILVSDGDAVEENTVVLILEAMKMENQITAGRKGKVGRVAVNPGDSVDEGQLLLEIEVS